MGGKEGQDKPLNDLDNNYEKGQSKKEPKIDKLTLVDKLDAIVQPLAHTHCPHTNLNIPVSFSEEHID